MDCTEARNKMHAVIDREVNSPGESEELNVHCSGCAGCRNEFETLDALHNRMREFSQRISSPEGMQARLKARLDQEPEESDRDNVVNLFGVRAPRGLVMAAAAAAVVLIAAPILMQPGQAPQVAKAPETKPVIQIAAVPAAPAHVSDIVAHFGDGHSSRPAEVVDQKALANAAGFPIKVPSLDGFKLANGDVCDVAGKRFVRLTYSGALGGKEGTLVCYMCPTGAFDGAGLDTHIIGGRKVCCGQMQALSVVYMPAKTKGTDWVMIANSSKADLMDVALKS